MPITGFANAIAAPAVEFQTEGFILGVGAKIFTIAGPVIVYGLGASAVYGLIYFSRHCKRAAAFFAAALWLFICGWTAGFRKASSGNPLQRHQPRPDGPSP